MVVPRILNQHISINLHTASCRLIFNESIVDSYRRLWTIFAATRIWPSETRARNIASNLRLHCNIFSNMYYGNFCTRNLPRVFSSVWLIQAQPFFTWTPWKWRKIVLFLASVSSFLILNIHAHIYEGTPTHIQRAPTQTHAINVFVNDIYICMYVDIYIYTYICICIYIYLHIYTYRNTHTKTHKLNSHKQHVHTLACTWTTYVYKIHAWVLVGIYTCTHSNLHNHVHTHTYVCMNTYAHVFLYLNTININRNIYECWIFTREKIPAEPGGRFP